MNPSSFRHRIPCVLAALSLALAGQASASILLYSDDFSGSPNDPLHGTTPPTAIGTNTWNADLGWRADGSYAAGASSANGFLPFSPSPGLVYTLTATLDKPTGSGGGTWAAIGFTEADDASGTSLWPAPNNAGPWVLYRANTNDVAAFGGPGIGGVNSGDVGPYTGPQTLTIELDTTGPQWTAEWFVGADSIHQVTYTTNPTINFVGLGQSNNATVNFSNFSLSVVPEPSTALLGAMGMMTLLLRRRRG